MPFIVPLCFSLPPIGGDIINRVYVYDSAEGFHFLLVQKTKQKSTPLKKKGWLGWGYAKLKNAEADH